MRLGTTLCAHIPGIIFASAIYSHRVDVPSDHIRRQRRSNRPNIDTKCETSNPSIGSTTYAHTSCLADRIMSARAFDMLGIATHSRQLDNGHNTTNAHVATIEQRHCGYDRSLFGIHEIESNAADSSNSMYQREELYT